MGGQAYHCLTLSLADASSRIGLAARPALLRSTGRAALVASEGHGAGDLQFMVRSLGKAMRGGVSAPLTSHLMPPLACNTVPGHGADKSPGLPPAAALGDPVRLDARLPIILRHPVAAVCLAARIAVRRVRCRRLPVFEEFKLFGHALHVLESRHGEVADVREFIGELRNV